MVNIARGALAVDTYDRVKLCRDSEMSMRSLSVSVRGTKYVLAKEYMP